MMLDVAVIIVSWNVRDYLTNCIGSVYADAGRSGLHVKIWVVDNNSTDGTVEKVASMFPRVHIIRNQNNVGFGAANNQGIQAAAKHTPNYYFLLNPDTVIKKGALKALIDFMEDHPKVGLSGARLVYGDGSFQHSAFSFPGIKQLLFDLFPMPARLYESRLNGRYPRAAYDPDQPPFSIDFPLGATMMVRSNVVNKTKGFDESFHIYCEEIDWSWRIREAGWEVYTVPSAQIVHYGGESTKQIPARSFVNLWKSRSQLYKAHHSPFHYRIAAKLVQFAMYNRQKKENNPEMKQAYQTVIELWK